MKIFGRYLTLSLLMFVSTAYSAQAMATQDLWQDVSQAAAKEQSDNKEKSEVSDSGSSNPFNNARLLQLDTSQMQTLLNTSLSRDAAYANRAAGEDVKQQSTQISLPLPDGKTITVLARYSEVLPEALANKYPEIKTFRLVPDKNIISGRVDMTPAGFHAMLQMHKGEMVFIDPLPGLVTGLSNKGQQNAYASYRKKDQHINQHTTLKPHQCLLDNTSSGNVTDFLPDASPLARSQQVSNRTDSRSVEDLLQYRIAVAATGEYTTMKGGKSAALSAIASTLNRVNQVYEQDLGIHLSLVEDNDEIIFTDANSDPYTSAGSHDLINKNQEVINSRIGAGNYDLGHLFTTSGGGLAVIGSVCDDNTKAMGISGTANPGNDSFTLDFVAHEIGHQLGATHTFNGSEGLCSGNTRTARTAFEPGSGSTIMSYAGICGSDNLQSHADAMFHIGSIEQVRAYTQSGNGSRCGIRATLSNEPPQPDAGNDYVIPANTPFELSGTALDPEGDRLVYAWEQIDVGTSSQEFEDKGNNALFRAHLPNQSSSRSFPPIGNIISQRIARGESLPISERVLRFRLVAQDGHNSAQSDEMSISVKRTGSRFALDLPRSHYSLGRDYKLGWNTANTDQAPVNCDNVDIWLSTDGGYNFDHALAEGVPNTGEAWVYLSSALPESSRARFKLSCTNNVFFTLSYRDFSLTLADIADAPEPGPEPDLLDRSTSVSTSTSTSTTASPSSASTSTTVTTSGSSSGGGLFNPLWVFLLVLVRFLRRY